MDSLPSPAAGPVPPPPPVPPADMPPPDPALPSSEERTLAMICHLCGLPANVGVPGLGIIVPLVMYFVKKDESRYVAYEALQCIVWQILVHVIAVIGIVLVIVCVGWLVLGALWVVNVIFTIVGAVRCHEGRWFSYPVVGGMIRP